MKRSIWEKRQVELREALINMRKSKGLTQVQLANEIFKPQSYISKYESGERILDFIEVSDICVACNVKFSKFAKSFEKK